VIADLHEVDGVGKKPMEATARPVICWPDDVGSKL
jgi:hypothetical protein